ncbi:MAG: hypothetical protein U0228_25220 [Myxococcaceae bacterium]
MHALRRWLAVAVVSSMAAWAGEAAKLTKEGEALFKEAEALKKAKKYESAAVRLEKCVAVSPGHYPCYRLLGSVYASIGARDQSSSDIEKARKNYEKFLELAPPNDEYVAKVKQILAAE